MNISYRFQGRVDFAKSEALLFKSKPQSQHIIIQLGQ